MSKHTEKALEVFSRGGNCCQAVVLAFCEEYGLEEKQAVRVAAGLGGGVKSGEICGAVSGAAIVIGLKYGEKSASDPEAKRLCTEKTQAFVQRFKAQHGALVCRELLKKGIETEGGPQMVEHIGGHAPICYRLVKDAVMLLEDRPC